MTSEQTVKSLYPVASAHHYAARGSTRYIVWSEGPRSHASRRLGEGKSRAEAWEDAAREIVATKGES